jgi:ergothioneine biosynthesis protein EgtB
MPAPSSSLDRRHVLLNRLREARAATDSIFPLVKPEALYDRPIPERHRIVFYLGHLEAFDWNLLGRGDFRLDSFHPEFDKLFAFGIDPVSGDLPTDQPADWPGFVEIGRYNERVRQELDWRLDESFASRPPAADDALLHVAIEHRLMHAETLAYLLHRLPLERKIPHETLRDATPPIVPRTVTIPEGFATLGQPRNGGRSFGWDNEFEAYRLNVPGFSIDAYPVTNGQFLAFLGAGGYDERSLWKDEDWEWKNARRISHPNFWVRPTNPSNGKHAYGWQYRGMFAQIPLPLAWPVCVSHAEASTYARWAGKKLPTEAQWHRAAYGTPWGHERLYPWGDEPPTASRGNFDLIRWDPTAVNAHPAGVSAFGAADMMGNGWEWTSTPFAPFPGFEPFPFYPGYSADFFDGRHFVAKGGSWRTANCLLRRSFRNWFQPRYPYVHATFRCVED